MPEHKNGGNRNRKRPKPGKIIEAEVVTAKRPPWRPTKLTRELCDNLAKLVEEWDPFRDVNLDNPKANNAFKIVMEYLDFCVEESLCLKIGINAETLRDVIKNQRASYDPDLVQYFSGVLKEWHTKRNSYHLRIRPFFTPIHGEATWIFLSKNFNRFVDVYRIGNIPGEDFKITESVRRVQSSDPARIAQSVERAKSRTEVRH